MGRTVADAALMLDAMAGLDARDPLSLEAPARPFADAAAAPALPLRVAYSPDLGVTPVAAEVRDACGRAVERLAAAGVEVEEASPDLTGAPEAFQVLRGAGFVAGMEPLYATDRDRLKPDIIWNIEFGLSLSVERIAQAEQARGALFQRMSEFMAGYDLLLCPTACVAPFDVSTRWIREVSGVTFDNYVEWLRITSAITLTSCPVVALPCELTEEGLPVGMQLVGRPRGEWQLLSAAAAVEQVFDLAGRVPHGSQGRLSVVGRFAPSPSGPMHLGNARTALLAWLDARARGGGMLLRIEDLDRDRCRPEYAQAIRDDLAWLGLDWDAETRPQSQRDPDYAARPGAAVAAGAGVRVLLHPP